MVRKKAHFQIGVVPAVDEEFSGHTKASSVSLICTKETASLAGAAESGNASGRVT